jgi:hypothetical protein
MRLFELHSWRLAPGVWLWSLAFVLPPALAAIAASKPDGTTPQTTVAASDPSRAIPVSTPAPDERETLQVARRVLIDYPAGDAMASLVNDILLFDSAPKSNALTPAVITAAAKAAATEPFTIETDVIETDAAEPEDDVVLPMTVETDPAESSAPELTPELSTLRDRVRKVLGMYYPRHQNARDNTPWEVMHAIIAYGVQTQIFKDGPGSTPVNAVGWMCYNYPCAGQRILFLNRGKIDASRGVGVQGHGGQFLAILAQSRVMDDYPMRVEGKSFTMADLIEREKETCVAGEELTFKLIALSHYLDSDAEWTTPDGQQWSIQRLIREELKAPVRGAACGGTHRLMGFSYALNKRAARGKPIVGEFSRAQKFIQDYHKYAFSLQNPDGSFSTAWFERKANEPSIDRKLKTSGHILEWIGFSLSDQELRDPRMVKAVDYVSTILLENGKHTWEIGPLGHGLHSLALYDERVFKKSTPPSTPPLAGQSADMDTEARRPMEPAN